MRGGGLPPHHLFPRPAGRAERLSRAHRGGRGGAPLLLSNGNPVESRRLDGRPALRRLARPHPKPSYLFALVGGDLGSIRTDVSPRSGREVELGIYVEKGKEPRAAYAMDSLKRSMKWDEEVRPRIRSRRFQDRRRVATSTWARWRTRASTSSTTLCAGDAGDRDRRGLRGIESIVAHEYFHNWTGNRITCRDWFQLCLKEGLTVFRDQNFPRHALARR
jgi:aminopeptidase N